MKRPRLEIDACGSKYIIVWYLPSNRNFTKLIESAFKMLKIDHAESVKIPVLLLPVKKKGDPERIAH